MTRVLIIGSTGTVGSQVISQLLGTGVSIRALTRSPHRAQFPCHVEAITGDLTVPASLDKCLDGIDSVFLVWTASGATVPAVIERIANNARRVVFLSSPYKTQHPLFQAAQPNFMSSLQADIERSIQASKLTWTFLRPGMFAANAKGWWAAQIRAGDVVRWPCALALTAPIHERDIAAVAVQALCEEKALGVEYVLTGPQALTHQEQVSTIGDVLGRKLYFEEITPEDWLSNLPPKFPRRAAEMLLKAWHASIGHPAFITSTVGELTGVPARSFRAWARDHAANFRSA